MKLQNIGKLIIIGLIAGIMTGCGGGSSSGSSTPPAETTNPGGTPSAPTLVDLDLKNVISSDNFYNYFQYTGQEGEKIIIHATLDNEVTRGQKVQCSISGGSFYLIRVYDINMNPETGSCGTDLTLEYLTDTTYIIQFKYSSDHYGENSGYFQADSVKP